MKEQWNDGSWVKEFQRLSKTRGLLFNGLRVQASPPSAARCDRDQRTAHLEWTVEANVEGVTRDVSRGYIEVPVRLRNGRTDRKEIPDGCKDPVRTEAYEPSTGYWWLRYSGWEQQLKLVLPADKVWFEVALDGYENQHMITHDLHADQLWIRSARLGKIEKSVLADQCIGPHNSARFGAR